MNVSLVVTCRIGLQAKTASILQTSGASSLSGYNKICIISDLADM